MLTRRLALCGGAILGLTLCWAAFSAAGTPSPAEAEAAAEAPVLVTPHRCSEEACGLPAVPSRAELDWWIQQHPNRRPSAVLDAIEALPDQRPVA